MGATRIVVTLTWVAITIVLIDAVWGYLPYLRQGYFAYPGWRSEFLWCVSLAFTSGLMALSAALLRGPLLTVLMVAASFLLGAGAVALAVVAFTIPHGSGGPGALLLLPGLVLAALTFRLGMSNRRRKSVDSANRESMPELKP
jgi:hypothetical protein